MRSRGILIISFCLTLLVIAVSYLPIQAATLVADDYRLLSPEFLANPWHYFAAELYPDYPDQVYWRPLPVLTFLFDRALHGQSSVLPHAVNLLLHLVTTLVVGLLILLPGGAGAKSGARVFGAVAGMLLFGLHPQATGTVAWMASRFDLMAGLFGALGLLCCARWIASERARSWWTVAGIAAFAIGVLCKESALAFPATVAAWIVVRMVRRREAVRPKREGVLLALQVALVLVYFGVRFLAVGQFGAGSGEIRPGLHLGTGAGFGLALVWPFAGAHGVVWPPVFIVTVLITYGLIALLAWRRSKQADERPRNVPWELPLLLLLASLTLLSLAPMLLVLILQSAESRLSYAPLIAAAVLFGWALERLWCSSSRWLTAAGILLAVVPAAVWGQQDRLARWEEAGRRVDGLLSQTLQLVPDPPEGSTLIFRDIPLTTNSFCYIFGIGLKEALAERYGRDDLTIIRWGTEEMEKNPPADAYVLIYHASDAYLTVAHRPE